jgi:hypothetical protein
MTYLNLSRIMSSKKGKVTRYNAFHPKFGIVNNEFQFKREILKISKSKNSPLTLDTEKKVCFDAKKRCVLGTLPILGKLLGLKGKELKHRSKHAKQTLPHSL